MYPKLVYVTNKWKCLLFHTSSTPPSLANPPAEGVWSLIKSQSAAKMLTTSPQRGRAMGEESERTRKPPLPCAFPTPCLFKHATVRLIRLNPKWLPSLQLTIHWINIRWRNRLVASTLQRGNCSCQYLSGNYYGKYLYDEERKDRTRTQSLIRHTINWADTETQCIAVNFPPE